MAVNERFAIVVRSFVTVAAMVALGSGGSDAQPKTKSPAPEVLRLYAGPAPGTENWTGAEVELDANLPAGKVHIITNVTVPTLTVFRARGGSLSNTAMIVVPGGAFRALAWDLDGTETARWLAAQGITAFVLKYRVRSPPNAGASKPESFDDFAGRTRRSRDIAVSDAREALRRVRAIAARYGIAPNRVGMIGFSAGAMTALQVALQSDRSGRPDFIVSAYGAMPRDASPPSGAPPIFLVAAQDDPEAPAAKSVEIYRKWSDAGLPAELHIYEKGGHGFAFRTHGKPVDNWPQALKAWLSSRGLLSPPRSSSGRRG